MLLKWQEQKHTNDNYCIQTYLTVYECHLM